MSTTPHWTIVGQGLAGTCLAWHLWHRGASFTIVDRGHGGSSRVAAGLINPVTGKNYEASLDLDIFLPLAMDFYTVAEQALGTTFWHPLPIIRHASSEKEWAKMQDKAATPAVARWITSGPKPSDGWHGAIELHGGGRLDTRSFLDRSRDFFTGHGCYRRHEVAANDPAPDVVWCDGAHGLMAGRHGPHRCAKGEILTVRAPAWDASVIHIGGGGWLVPSGKQTFKVGATYEWDQLDEQPTPHGLEQLVAIGNRLGGSDFEVISHDAGIRPILRRSEPLIGPLGNGQWMFNALGSKGSLYAPGIAAQLAAWLLDGTPCDPFFDHRRFSA